MARKWCKDEIDLLIANLDSKTNEEIAALVGMSVSAVKRQKVKLGLSKGFGSISVITEPAVDIAYLAGHFDGEGCVRMQPHLSGMMYGVRVSVVGNHLPAIEKYRKIFGGRIKTRSSEGKKILYIWIIESVPSCLVFLKSVCPYLMEKREQSSIAILFLERRIKESISHPSSDLREYSKLCAEKICLLKAG